MPILLLKIWAFLKSYYYIPIIAVVAIVLFYVFRKKDFDFWTILKEANEAHTKETKSIEKIEEKKQLEQEKAKKEYDLQVAYVEAQFIKEKQDLDNQKKQEIQTLVKKYQSSPEKMAAQIAKKYGFVMVPPKK